MNNRIRPDTTGGFHLPDGGRIVPDGMRGFHVLPGGNGGDPFALLGLAGELVVPFVGSVVLVIIGAIVLGILGAAYTAILNLIAWIVSLGPLAILFSLCLAGILTFVFFSACLLIIVGLFWR